MDMTRADILETPSERLELAKRYLSNAKELLNKAGTEEYVGEYLDIKYISEASGVAYLSALEALKALFLWEGLMESAELNERLKKVEMYDNYLKKLSRVGKDKDILRRLFRNIYDILHIGGYYRELRDKKAIDSGFEKVEKLVKIVEKYVK